MGERKHYNVVSLFSGAGGFILGFRQTPFCIVFSTDVDEYCESVHLRNFADVPFVRSDIRCIDEETLNQAIVGNIDVLIGGPPCQGFSTIGNRASSDPAKRVKSDVRNTLFREYVRILKHLRPKMFLMENVTGLMTRDKGKVFEEVRNEFNLTGYEFNSVVLNAADYGVPQMRKRVFFYGSRVHVGFSPPKPTHTEKGEAKWRTVMDAIADLADVELDESMNHVPLKHGSVNIRRYRMIPEGGRMPEANLPPELFRRNFGNTFKRLHRDKPALTMVPGHNAFPIHPWLDRSLTVREAARIQTFPDDFIFVGPRQKQCIQVGNAVPPLLSRAWAVCIKEALDRHNEHKQ